MITLMRTKAEVASLQRLYVRRPCFLVHSPIAPYLDTFLFSTFFMNTNYISYVTPLFGGPSKRPPSTFETWPSFSRLLLFQYRQTVFFSLQCTSVRSRSIFFDLTDLDRPRAKPTRPRSIFDRNRPFY